MSTIDIILALLLLIGFIRGFIHGFIYEIALLGVLFVCYFFGFKLAVIIADYLSKLFNANLHTVHHVSLFIAWIGISIGIFFLAKLLEGLIKIVALGIFNKIAGAIFGVLKYAVLISLGLFFINKFDLDFNWLNADTKADSILYYRILRMAAWIL